MKILKAPFTYIGGKSMIAPIVWKALGQPRHYIEPFAGSCSILLQRPKYDYKNHLETVCDSNGYICNVWRSIKFSPEETAKWADNPINHADLISRKKTLIKNEERLLENLTNDDMWHDPKLAGYWVWASSCSIADPLANVNQIPFIGHFGRGLNGIENREPNKIYKWFDALSNRLRYVRVVCGDWSRICGGDWQDWVGDAGIFMDPPYGIDDRVKVYANDSISIAHEVRQWCLERGDKKSYRIVLTGYDEHKELFENGWTAQSWKTRGGYGNTGNGRGKENSKREMIYFSPHCIKQTGLFGLIKG